MILKAFLNSRSIKQMAYDLRGFEEGFKENIRTFRELLAEKGIRVAMSSTSSGFGQYIIFEKIDSDETSTIIARETQQILSEWLRYGERMQAYVSPLLMAEFGSGNYAVSWEDSQGTPHSTLSDGTQIGRGSFPNQTHAFESVWWYLDVNGNWHSATGSKPTRPMHNAAIEIITQIQQTAREVFGHG